MNDLKNIQKFCSEIAVLAGKKIMEVYNDKVLFDVVDFKADNSPLTLADKLANDIIVENLRKQYKEYAILSEESKDDKSRLNNPYCFIVDPLDGTKEFIKRNGQFTVNIALAHNNKPVVGVIYVPATKQLFYASKDNGSYYCDENNNTQRIFVSNICELNKVRLVTSSSHGCKEMDELIQEYKFTNFVKMGSSLKGCLIAKGEAEIYYRHNYTMEWDTAAMQCIVEQAGGIFRQMDNTAMLYNRENSLNEKGFYIVNCEENILHNK